jgi:hypothetical protein
VGRIIDEIYNWEFEYEPLKYYLILQQYCGIGAVSLSFKRVEHVVGFALPQPAYGDSGWWQKNIANPLDKVRNKLKKKGKPGWKMDTLDICKQEIHFILS